MLNSNHPDDERLSALASREADATADASLTGHVSACDRCTELVNDLGALRISLAELPDLQPSRSLRFIPPADDASARADGIGGWARRLFAPVLTAGAALALVGLVGTASPALQGMASGPTAGDAGGAAPEAAEAAASEPASEERGAAVPSSAFDSAGDVRTLGEGEADPLRDASGSPAAEAPQEAQSSDEAEDFDAPDAEAATTETALPAERSLWPMLLFAGVAVMVGAGLARWILVPRS